MEIFQFGFKPMSSEHNLSSLPREGTVYLRSTSEQHGAVVWMKRDWDNGFDIRISNYGSGQFSILRSKSTLYLLDELAAMGHVVVDEDEFNNVFIDAASWILHNTPSNNPTPDPKPKPRRSRKAVLSDTERKQSM